MTKLETEYYISIIEKYSIKELDSYDLWSL